MWNFIQKNREITIIIAILFLFLLLSFKGEGFYLQTLTMIFNSSLIVILLATGTTFVILTRNIDVSIGSIMGLCAVILGILLNNGFNLICPQKVRLYSNFTQGLSSVFHRA
ncbi:Autoinducer 2 import system permease protein lsrC [Avibacterium paragallinarum]|uniref:Autoinducer 2 import system permease protein lsrC n=1 Tax=Avibacterium paragallinarum TaxID=728 RepID=A0A380Z409_AVIPA|nr:Autoinducer 2 import system permease protein lsrC [Avibacterium paragallinarum]